MQTKFKFILVFSLCIASAFVLASTAFASGDHQHDHDSISPFGKTSLNLHCLLKGHSLNNPCPHILKHLGGKSLPHFIGSNCGGSPSQNNIISSGFDFHFVEFPIKINSIFSAERTPKLRSEISSFLFYESIKPPPRFL
jgi:hypothetical protein